SRIDQATASVTAPNLHEQATASVAAAKPEEQAPASVVIPRLYEDAPRSAMASVEDAMGNELKSLRRMLETQLAQLAWNDRTRRAPVHTELLRELTEIGIAQDLADH